MPWKPLSNKRTNIAFAIVGLCISLPLVVLAMVRCRNSWSFILIAVWKVTLSLTLTIMTIHAARLIPPQIQYARQLMHGYGQHYGRHHHHSSRIPLNGHSEAGDNLSLLSYGDDELPGVHEGAVHAAPGKSFGDIWWWLYFYFLGSVVGFTGVMNLVKHNFADPDMAQLRTITFVFCGVAAGLTLFAAFVFFCPCGSGRPALGIALAASWQTFIFALLILTVLFAFYADWVLAALYGDLVGRPSSDNAVFYWIYFAAKRIPMLSF